MDNKFPRIMTYENPWAHKKRWEWISKQIKEYKIGTVIDVGCGAGGFLTIPLMLDNPDVAIHGLDISEKSINAAKRAAHFLELDEGSFIQNSIYNISSQYECVICSEVMEHIEKDLLIEFTDQLKKTICDDGFLIITVPNGKGSYEKGVRFRKTVWGNRIFRMTELLCDAINKLLFKKLINKQSESNRVFTMTESDSEHVNFFSKQDIIDIFSEFSLLRFEGSNRFSGCFITLVPQFEFLTRINNWLGSKKPEKAADYYFLFKKVCE